MRKIVKAAGRAATAKQEPPIQVRPQPEIREKLRQAADAAGRTMVKEAELRLAASVQGEHSAAELYPGWPAEDQVRFRSLGNVVGILAARVALVSGWVTPADLLTAVRASLDEILTALDASAGPSQHDKLFAMVAQQMVAEMRHAARMDHPSGENAALAETASAWALVPLDAPQPNLKKRKAT